MSTGAFQHYELSIVGRDLHETLEELIELDKFDPALKETVCDHFSRAMVHALATEVKTKVIMRGKIKDYGCTDDIWRFRIKPIYVQIERKALESSEMTQVVAVSTPKR